MPQHVYHVILLVYVVTKTTQALDDSPSPYMQSSYNVTNGTGVFLQLINTASSQSELYNSTESPPDTQTNYTAPKISVLDTDTTTTENVCISLCSIQMGGDACNCNNPVLPG